MFIHESSWCLPVCRSALCVRGSLGEACCATLILTYLIQDCMQKCTVTVTVTPAVLHSSFTLKGHPHIARTGNVVCLLEANVGGTPSSLNHMDARSGLLLYPNIAQGLLLPFRTLYIPGFHFGYTWIPFWLIYFVPCEAVHPNTSFL